MYPACFGVCKPTNPHPISDILSNLYESGLKLPLIGPSENTSAFPLLELPSFPDRALSRGQRSSRKPRLTTTASDTFSKLGVSSPDGLRLETRFT